jgi:hypothetical protein
MARFETVKENVEEVQHTAARAGRKAQQQAQAAGRKVLDAAEALKDDARRRLQRVRGHGEAASDSSSEVDAPETHGRLSNKAANARTKAHEKGHSAKAKARDAKDELVRIARKPYHHAPELIAYLGLTCIAFMIIAVLMRTDEPSVAGHHHLSQHLPHGVKPEGPFEQLARKIFRKPPQPPTAFEMAQDAATGAFDTAMDAASAVLGKSADVAEHFARKAGEVTIELAGDALHAAGHGVKEAGLAARDAAVKLGKHAV